MERADEPEEATDDHGSPVEVDATVLVRLERAVADVERALERLDDGTYGTCEACAAPLAPDVLAGDPAARYCEAHLPLGIA